MRGFGKNPSINFPDSNPQPWLDAVNDVVIPSHFHKNDFWKYDFDDPRSHPKNLHLRQAQWE